MANTCKVSRVYELRFPQFPAVSRLNGWPGIAGARPPRLVRKPWGQNVLQDQENVPGPSPRGGLSRRCGVGSVLLLDNHML